MRSNLAVKGSALGQASDGATPQGATAACPALVGH
jgi:hypothetical protein